MTKADRKRLEEVLKRGAPSDLCALIPAHARGNIEPFMRCFGIKSSDFARVNR